MIYTSKLHTLNNTKHYTHQQSPWEMKKLELTIARRKHIHFNPRHRRTFHTFFTLLHFPVPHVNCFTSDTALHTAYGPQIQFQTYQNPSVRTPKSQLIPNPKTSNPIVCNARLSNVHSACIQKQSWDRPSHRPLLTYLTSPHEHSNSTAINLTSNAFQTPQKLHAPPNPLSNNTKEKKTSPHHKHLSLSPPTTQQTKSQTSRLQLFYLCHTTKPPGDIGHSSPHKKASTITYPHSHP